MCVCGMWSWNRGAYIIKVFRTVVVQNARVRAAANFLAMSHVRGEARRGESPSSPFPPPLFAIFDSFVVCVRASWHVHLPLLLSECGCDLGLCSGACLSPPLSLSALTLSLSLSFCVTEETRTALMTMIMTMIVGAECENNWWMRRRLPQWGFG